MKFYLGLGSNESDRKLNLTHACQKIARLPLTRILRISPLYETPALLPEHAPPEWNKPFLNLALECDTDFSPLELLRSVKKIEQELGRESQGRWSPRIIDIDLLLAEGVSISTPELILPHPRLLDRAFVLDPLKDLLPDYILFAKKHAQHAPLFMGILNITPDSFSESHGFQGLEHLNEKLNAWDDHFVPVIDVGAESTRPGATALTEGIEWQRLEPVLHFLEERYRGQVIKPMISVDTRFSKTAEKALKFNVGMINDVSGFADQSLIEPLKGTQVQYVLMHSLSVPADRTLVLDERVDPVAELQVWFGQKIELLLELGLKEHQIWLDPGIGFGKTSSQSLELLRNLERFKSLPFKLLVGHSRKSFFNSFVNREPKDRDLETIGLSLNLSRKGVDLLRVHDPVSHLRAFQAFNHAN